LKSYSVVRADIRAPISTDPRFATFSGANQRGDVISTCGGIRPWAIRSSASPRSGRP
jgi:hypothetical protein